MASTLPLDDQDARPLATGLAALAATADDAAAVADHLAAIAVLAADRVAGADYASVTSLLGGRYTTVAASSDLARAVDEVQYAERDGPCVRALRDGAPVTVPDVAATMNWPGFREVAAGLGLRCTLSVPLFVASGAPAAALNLFGRDEAAMGPLIAGIWSAFDPDAFVPGRGGTTPAPDPGGGELIDGFRRARAVRALIQQALRVVMAHRGCTARDAYAALVSRSREEDRSIVDIAAATLEKWR